MKPADESVKNMMGEHPSELDLMAYADGELDAPAFQRVRQYLAANPAAAAKVKLHQQLRTASRRAAQIGIAVPEYLHQRILGLANPSPYDDRGYPLDPNYQPPPRAPHPPAPPVINRWRIGFVPLAAAALLILGIGLVLVWTSLNRGPSVVLNDNTKVIPVSWVTSTAQHHIECSHHASHFGPGFPRTLHEMPASLHDYLGHDAIVPDLSKFGYQFAGCGPCTIPGGKTAHLLYRPAPGGNISTYTVSLFLQSDINQLPLETNKVYLSNDTIDKTPMIIWRNNGIVYYLVAEDNTQLSLAAKEMGMKLKI